MKLFSNKFEDFVLDMVTDIRSEAINPRRTVVVNMDTVVFLKRAQCIRLVLKK